MLILIAVVGLPGCKGESRVLAAPIAASVPIRAAPVVASTTPPPERVLREWAAAIARRDWTAVRGLWGHGGADSGLSPRAFARRWNRLRQPRATIGPGAQEGAAGSLYYTAPVMLHDGACRAAQVVTIRRVNDIDGASAEQLRWHFERSTRLVLPRAGGSAKPAAAAD